MLDTILSLDPITLAAGAAIAVGAILAPIVILKKRRKNVYNPLTNPVSTNDAYKTEIDDFSPETYTVGTEDFTGNSNGIKPKNLSNDYNSESILDDEMIYELDNNQDRMKSAIDLDKMGKRAKVAQLLKIMLDKEEDQKEQKRLQVIIKYYNKGEMKLSDLCAKFPTLIKNPQTQKAIKTDENFDGVFSNREDSSDEEMLSSSFKNLNSLPNLPKEEKVNRQSPPVLTEENVFSKPMEEKSPDLNAVEESLREIAQVAHKQDMEKEDDSSEVLRELSALAGMSAHKKPERAEKVIYSKEVWANWMSMTNGKMGLKTKFISLENKWPNKAAVEELEQKINTIMGKDANGNQNPWALISVHQLHEGN